MACTLKHTTHTLPLGLAAQRTAGRWPQRTSNRCRLYTIYFGWPTAGPHTHALQVHTADGPCHLKHTADGFHYSNTLQMGLVQSTLQMACTLKHTAHALLQPASHSASPAYDSHVHIMSNNTYGALQLASTHTVHYRYGGPRRTHSTMQMAPTHRKVADGLRHTVTCDCAALMRLLGSAVKCTVHAYDYQSTCCTDALPCHLQAWNHWAGGTRCWECAVRWHKALQIWVTYLILTCVWAGPMLGRFTVDELHADYRQACPSGQGTEWCTTVIRVGASRHLASMLSMVIAAQYALVTTPELTCEGMVVKCGTL